MTQSILPERPLVSLIIRAKNEERWIGSCLNAVFSQNYQNFEVILVDNMSTDRTLVKAQKYPIKLVTIEEFLPGKAINDGIRASKGDVVVCLSAHCVPVNEYWLENLIRELHDPEVAGVYGRQEPLSFTSDVDKRDLMITFGLDRKEQRKDSFFHNANSAIRRELLEVTPFDESLTNIEDRFWAKQVLSKGFKIVYEPEASVYHHHGIHHERDPSRAQDVMRVMERIDELPVWSNATMIDDLYVVTIIPTRGAPKKVGNISLVDITLDHAFASRYVKDVFVATDNVETAQIAKDKGAKVPALRPTYLSQDYINVREVLKWAINEIEEIGEIPDLVVVLEETQPFRPRELVDDMIVRVVNEGLDGLIAAKEEPRRIWEKSSDDLHPLTDRFIPRQFSETSTYVSLLGLAFVVRPGVLREGDILGSNMAFYEVATPLCGIEVRDNESLTMVAPLLELMKEGNLRC